MLWALWAALVAGAEPVPDAPPVVLPEEPAARLSDPAELEPGPRPDRAAPPPVRPAELLPHPRPEVEQLGAATLRHVRLEGVRKVAVRLVLHRGAADLDGGMTARMRGLELAWGLEAEGWEPEALEAEQDRLDISLQPWVSHARAGIDLSVPREHLAEGVALLRSVVRSPVFGRREVKQVSRAEEAALVTRAANSVRALGGYALAQGWYDADSPYGTRVEPADWRALRPADLEEAHARLVREAPVTLWVVGEVSREEMIPLVRPLLDGLGRQAPPSPEPVARGPRRSRVLAVALPGPDQVLVGLRTDAPRSGEPERVAFELADFALGGSFLSRLNRNLREEHGYTYGIYSSYLSRPQRGYWSSRTVVSVADVAEAIGEIEGELGALLDGGIRPGELEAGQRAAVAEWNEVRATADRAADFYEELLYRGWQLSTRRADIEAMDGLDPEGIGDRVRAWLRPEAVRLWVLVGDPERLADELEALGWSEDARWLGPEEALWGRY